MSNRVAILGSTGSIGTSALDVASRLPDRISIVALSTHSRIDDLAAQVERFKPRYAAITGSEPTAAQRKRIELAGATLLLGEAALCEIVHASEVDTVLLAVIGAAGVRAAIETVSLGKTLALANKESLVVAGSIVMPLARKHGASVLPVDSEHSAVSQCLRSGTMSEVARVILTASGGPFRDSTDEEMAQATVSEDIITEALQEQGGADELEVSRSAEHPELPDEAAASIEVTGTLLALSDGERPTVSAR